MRHICGLVLCGVATLALAACTPTLPPIRPDGDVGSSTSDIAVVEIPVSWVSIVYIKQGDRTYYEHGLSAGFHGNTEIWLKPGPYEILYGAASAQGRPTATRQAVIDLKAGHRYVVEGTDCVWSERKQACGFNWWMNSRLFAWFLDLTTNQIVDGSKTEPAPIG